MMPLEEIRPGMQGTARTVFEGESLEEFGVEILGVLKSAVGPDQDLILARLRGEKVEYTGVVSGMSGSPVYVGGRLVGAISYRVGAFGKEAIAGVTPIADMLKLAGGAGAPRSGRAGAAPDLLGRFLSGGTAAAEGGSASAGQGGLLERGVPSERTVTTGLGGTGLQPIGIPLICSGCDAGVLRHYAPIFESFGLEPAAGGGMTEAGAPPPLAPGMPIGGALVTGSLSLTGIGTLTHVDGARVFGFGHPLLGIGPMEMPMTQARVLATFPSTQASFKIANATPPIGTIVHDGITAIVGEIGPIPRTLPLSVSVTSPTGRREFKYDILRNRAWSPVLVALSTASSLVRTTEFDAGATLALRYRVDLEGYPMVEMEDLYSGVNPAQPAHLAVANDAAGLFNVLYNNRFEEPRVRSTEVAVEVLPESLVASLASVRASRTEVRPGETLRVTAILRRFRGEEKEVSWDFTVPEDTTAGEADIIVGSGPAIDALERRVVERQVAQASGLRDLIRLMARQRQARSIYLRMTRRSPTAIVRSEVLPDLPLSIFSVFNNPRLSADTTLMSEATILELQKDLDIVAVGGRRISVRVK
jgi:hypothetical protein